MRSHRFMDAPVLSSSSLNSRRQKEGERRTRECQTSGLPSSPSPAAARVWRTDRMNSPRDRSMGGEFLLRPINHYISDKGAKTSIWLPNFWLICISPRRACAAASRAGRQMHQRAVCLVPTVFCQRGAQMLIVWAMDVQHSSLLYLLGFILFRATRWERGSESTLHHCNTN